MLIYAAVNLHIRFSRSEEECWALVFKIATGAKERAYELFISDISSNVNDKEAMSLQCSDNQVKKHFNIKGKSHHHSGNYSRRFYMRNDESDGCVTDAGWLLVSDDKGNCQYEYNIETKPFILFSDKLTSSKAEEFAVADIMAIFVKLKIKATCLNPFALHCEHDNSPSTTISVQTTSTNTIPIDEQSMSTVSTSKNGDQSTTMTSEKLQNKIDRIKMELTVQKQSTKKYRRSLTSAPDERTSSKLMGMIGGTFIISVIGFIVLLDCATCNMGRKANNLHIRFSRSEEECWALVFKIATGVKDTCFDQLAMNCVHENSACITKSVHTSSTNTGLLDDQAQSTVSTSKDEAQSTTMRNEDLEKENRQDEKGANGTKKSQLKVRFV
ncbi:unnamed protein product [Mytilus edulis]|uniref:Uncharacterized protein n=1 Tax=Mytilus edulis TaxID=6550 RepID=A0A8S3SGC9_MYTED|nr:unnamed protein product [Mytilus edulis]